MGNVVRHINNLPQPYTQGLGLKIFGKPIRIGKWAREAVRWVGEKAAQIAEKVPVFGGELSGLIRFVFSKIDTGLQNLGMNGKAVLDSSELSDGEEAALNAWLPYFAAFVELLIKELGTAASLKTATAQIAALNHVLNKINAVQDHYLTYPDITPAAEDQRNFLIYQSFQAVNELALKMIEGIKNQGVAVSQVQVVFPISNYNFSPLFTDTLVTTVTGDNYKVTSTKAGSNIQLTKSPFLTTSKGTNTGIVPVATTPATPVATTGAGTTTAPVITTGGKLVTVTTTKGTTTLDTETGEVVNQVPATTQPGTTQGGTPEPTGNDNTMLKILGAAVGGYALSKLFGESKGSGTRKATGSGRKPAKAARKKATRRKK